ncbi:MAG: hypothetical protein HKO93_04330, partial [Flavobacteriales bacterium]|nr:hypothetical protein [Flavobacteriales bacterium]
SGVDKQVGAVYKQTLAMPGIDVTVTIVELSGGTTLNKFDDNAIGNIDAFQPVVTKSNSLPDEYARFRFDFYLTGTSTPVHVSETEINAVDVDGCCGLYEYATFYSPSTYALEDPTFLTAVSIDGGWRFEGPAGGPPGIDYSITEYIAKVKYYDVQSITIDIGSNGMNSWPDRQASIFFDEIAFTDPDEVAFTEAGQCGDGIDNDGDGKIDNEDPQCFDNDGDGLANALDQDDDNDGIPDSLDSRSDIRLFEEFGIGTSISGTGLYTVEGTNVGYASSFVGSECVTYDAGLQGPALYITKPSNSFTPLRFDFTPDVYNLSFKITDIDWIEEFDLYVYDENFDLYDLNYNGVVSLGSNILQNQPDGRRFTGQGLGIDTDGNDPANDHICSAVFHFPGRVGTVVLNIRTFSGNSIRLTEMNFNVIDTDSDGYIDSWDLDSDNDGIYDVIEAGGIDADGDGVIGTGAITDTDVDGWSDISDPDNGGILLPDPDTDGTGGANRIDSDSDADGCSDVIEAGFSDSDGDQQLGGLVPPTVDSKGVVTSGGM